jgi:hypothetical protein
MLALRRLLRAARRPRRVLAERRAERLLGVEWDEDLWAALPEAPPLVRKAIRPAGHKVKDYERVARKYRGLLRKMRAR